MSDNICLYRHEVYACNSLLQWCMQLMVICRLDICSRFHFPLHYSCYPSSKSSGRNLANRNWTWISLSTFSLARCFGSKTEPWLIDSRSRLLYTVIDLRSTQLTDYNAACFVAILPSFWWVQGRDPPASLTGVDGSRRRKGSPGRVTPLAS